jgi:rubrerythrin
MTNNTTKNLEIAFSGESQANRKYTAFSRKADQEGLKQIAKLFRAVAEAETVHALNHFKVMGVVGATNENIRNAIKGETYEFTEMYPSMMKSAEKEKEIQARSSFRLANEVEKIHAQLYEKALQSVEEGKDLSAKNIFVCQVCGNTVEGVAPDHCPICGASKDRFKKIE